MNYSGIDTTFLREVAEGINLSFRFYGNKNKDALLRILRKKLTIEKMDFVSKMYLMCCDAQEVVQVIKPKGMSEIVESVENFFKAQEYLHEVTVGSRRCDVVFFVGNRIIAVEVKSSLDKLSSVLAQLEDYKKWANEVYLAYDVRHKQKVKQLQLTKKGIGLLEFKNGDLYNLHNSAFQEKSKVDFLALMTYNYLRKIATTFTTDLKGGKQAIAERLSPKISLKETKELFKEFLGTRALI